MKANNAYNEDIMKVIFKIGMIVYVYLQEKGNISWDHDTSYIDIIFAPKF